MPELSAELVLRPTRIGFLTRPTDLTSVRAIMRACVCLWGGVYNPIIPVFQRAPKEWRPEIFQRFKGAEVAKGYARFFEPDVYVEAESGLLEEAGFGALREKHTLHPQIVTLKEFFEPDRDRKSAEPAFGLNAFDVLAHIYKTEQQFELRDKRDHLLVTPVRASVLTEAVFGVYPSSDAIKYIEKAYREVYRPEKAETSPDTWRRVFFKGAGTPLDVTRHGLNTQRYWYHDPLIYVFDPGRATDLIDLWNLRLEPHPILPIPADWFAALADDICRVLKAEHRPVAGSPNGLMHNATIEFGRSISRDKAEDLIKSLKPGLPKGALAVKYWRNSIWVEYRDDIVHRDHRLRVIAKEKRAELVVKDNSVLRTSFDTLVPEFAERPARANLRWVNVLSISNFSKSRIATVLPFNTFDSSWPRLGLGNEAVLVGSEGWVFPQCYTNLGQYVSMLTDEEAVIGALERFGIKAKLSDPGHIARQMLEHLGGLWGVHLLADIDTLKLLKKMAGSLRRQSNDSDTIEETFELRTATRKEWTDLISSRKKRMNLPRLDLEDFTKRNIIRLGLATDCPHCNAKNWTPLTVVDYRVTCERCLKPYDFPQAALRPNNQNFTYRVIGPFSAPDYGRGSYSALLTLNFLERFNSSTGEMTFSTAMDLEFDGTKCEVDFVALRGDDRLGRESRKPPQLIIGEAKSLGEGNLITARDIAKLKSVAAKLPETIVVISVLRDRFTAPERKLLTKFVNWGRRVNLHGEPTNPVVLLTEHELTMDYLLSEKWKKLGGAYAAFADYEHTRHLLNIADATQAIYLDLPSFHEVRRKYWETRIARRQAMQKPVKK